MLKRRNRLSLCQPSLRRRRVYGCPKAMAAIQKARIAAGFRGARQTGSVGHAPQRRCSLAFCDEGLDLIDADIAILVGDQPGQYCWGTLLGYFAGVLCWGTWRREPESNRRTRLCRPLHNHSAIAPIASPPSLVEGLTLEDCLRNEKGSLKKLPLQNWSGRRVSNSRPQPWQGCALPTELLPQTAVSDRSGILAGFIHKSKPSGRTGFRPDSGGIAQVGPCPFQVVEHRPQRQHRRHIDQPGADLLYRDHAWQWVVVEQHRNRDQLRSRLELAD